MQNQRSKTADFVPPGGWLWQFASMFHQDYGLAAKGFKTGAERYIAGLAPEQRKALRAELSAFLAKHADLPPNSLKRMWMKSGAVWCQRGINMREALEDVLGKL